MSNIHTYDLIQEIIIQSAHELLLLKLKNKVERNSKYNFY